VELNSDLFDGEVIYKIGGYFTLMTWLKKTCSSFVENESNFFSQPKKHGINFCNLIYQ
jgi:hypothetical protein